MSEQTEEQLRAEVTSEVFGNAAEDAPSPEPKPEPETKVVAAETPAEKPAEIVDELDGVSPGLRKTIESMKQQMGEFDAVKGRLKQAESRLGKLINDQTNAATKAAQTVKEAPSAAQIEAAAGSKDRWEKLMDLWPEFAEEYKSLRADDDKNLAAKHAEILSQIPKTDDLKADIEKLRSESKRLHESMLTSAHRDWRKINESQEFWNWLKANNKSDSENPEEVIAVLDEYKAHIKGGKVASSIAKEREERLAQHTTVPGHKVAPAKSEADMSPAELRKAVEKEVYGTA